MKEVSIIGVDLEKNEFQAARGSSGRVGRLPQEAVATAICSVHGGVVSVPDCDGGVSQRASLGAGNVPSRA